MAAEQEVDEGVDGAVQGGQVLDDHRGVDALPGVGKEAEIVQHVEEEVRTPTADEGWVGGRQPLAPQEATPRGRSSAPGIPRTYLTQR